MKTLTLTIDGFDYNARGVARHDGKTVFVSGALPGERVVARITADKKRFLETDAVQILEPSPARITPACAYYDDCGGCALQAASPGITARAPASPGTMRNKPSVSVVAPHRAW